MLDRLAGHSPVMKTVSLPRRRHRLHVMPTSTGCETRADAGYFWNGLKRGRMPFTVLQYTMSGVGFLNYEHREYRLEPGSLMIVTIPNNHRYWAAPGRPWQFFWLSMTGQEALRLHRMLLRVVGPVFRPSPQTIEIVARCSLDLIESAHEASGSVSTLAYRALMAIYDDALGTGGPDRAGLDEKLQRVLDYVRAHLDCPMSVTALAALAEMSRSHFTRHFTACEGQPPAEFIMQERMRKASRLLATEALSVGEVARQCGFADPNYFSKVFRRNFDISPTEFRTTGMYVSSSRQGVSTHTRD
ncbi:MAG TPA: AraC family transcriptional regulator [Salinisphaera sp.]|nr:AraC family transcriptional regulator [Salinisphaera sp.]HET7314178.1 AraC family transcriptional regulator [Salinisphaera sp.]